MERELFYPEVLVTIGNYEFEEGVEIEVYSSADSYFDWAKVKFTKQFQDKLSITRREPARIELGYDGDFHTVFDGYVVSSYNEGEGQDEILLKDGMIMLEDTIITNTFLEVTPQEVMNYLLSKSGVLDSKLTAKMLPKKARIPILRKNAIDVIQEIQNIWKIQEPFYFAENVFYWGAHPQQTDVYEFVYAENIINLERSSGVWELETVSAPFIRHSHEIRVQHPKISGEFTVKRVIFSTEASGFIRTRIFF